MNKWYLSHMHEGLGVVMPNNDPWHANCPTHDKIKSGVFLLPTI